MKFFEHLQSIATEAWPAEIMVILMFKVWHRIRHQRHEREKLRHRCETQLEQAAQGEQYQITKMRAWVKRLKKEEGA